MSPPPNELYTVFSFIGFVLCAIPLYWHLQGTWYHVIGVLHPKNVRCSLEYGHLLVHDLDRTRMPIAMHKLDRMEQEHDQQGSGLL
jgi:hypothetical protein